MCLLGVLNKEDTLQCLISSKLTLDLALHANFVAWLLKTKIIIFVAFYGNSYGKKLENGGIAWVLFPRLLVS